MGDSAYEALTTHDTLPEMDLDSYIYFLQLYGRIPSRQLGTLEMRTHAVLCQLCKAGFLGFQCFRKLKVTISHTNELGDVIRGD